MFLPFLDHLIQELTRRLVSNEDRFSAQYLIPTKLNGINQEVINTLFVTFRNDLNVNNVAQFREEVERWIVRLDIAADPKPSTLSETLPVTNSDLYPNIYICLLILVTMPVTTATGERSFSVMRRVKTYVRSTMHTERLSSLSILHAYKHWEIDIEKFLTHLLLRRNVVWDSFFLTRINMTLSKKFKRLNHCFDMFRLTETQHTIVLCLCL
ncbi:unnamed protein product [Mytilus edulis]|uniref:HAT C-terminal dimerisation domain-containing protein n=1 Tax=Mytilus edulis TaxID=6550 RepID=A0A8S3R8H2_MYTED|nr:unnamed protein product [Mytilus edulis]